MSNARPISPIQKLKKRVSTAVKASNCSKKKDSTTITQEDRIGVSVLRLTRARLTALVELSAALRKDERIPQGESFLSQNAKEHLETVESLIGVELIRIDDRKEYADLKEKHDEYAKTFKNTRTMESLTKSDVAKIMYKCDVVAQFAEVWPGQTVKARMLRMTVARLNIFKTMVFHLVSLQGVPASYTAATSMLDSEFVTKLDEERKHIGNETSGIRNRNWKLGFVPGIVDKTVQSEAVRLAEEDYEFVGVQILCRLGPECIGWAFDGK